ncbi:MAG: riboflavin synthase subunit beta [Flavobacteriaceae bacterium]|nr:riboflavin synthase subunit beta [Flavobacteriaceae bacterium]
MGLFKLRKNKSYSYTPRHWDDKGEGSPYQIKHKFDDFRKTTGETGSLKTKFNNALEDFNTSDEEVNRRLFIIIAILLFIFLFIIDFDLTLFFS